eukprot:TRINITY_DN1868_c0_g1_i1.p1 TRINITY_DN1868_c0_g1~~TRINITY_DN1868_c0_g1_i1.p1  ORF type:complete len:272 (-),score=59.09 TRINITY_DN1868_c0_g1_i1:59-874(-)
MTARGSKSEQNTIASIIVPAYKEGKNIQPLVERVFAALDKNGKTFTKENTELLIVDDNSRDGSEEKVAELSTKGYPVRILVRTKERGLSSAVLHGFDQARGKYLLCMDADLQHPPEQVPDLLEKLQTAEFVIGTRYGKGVAIDKNWPLYRRVISATSRLMARPLTPLSDPMTGFFGITKEAYKRGKDINKIGFKICMELYVKCACRSAAEVPFSFGVRTEGESKLTGKVIVHYLQQLAQLYPYQYPWSPIAFVVAILLALYILLVILRSIF